MKKRDFLKGTVAGAAVAGSAGASSASSMLFGTPGSLDSKKDRSSALRLSLSKSSLPERTWTEVENFISAASRIFEDPQARDNFISSPQVYFSRAGVALELSRISREIEFLKVGLDSKLQEEVASGNYRPLFDAMKSANLHQGDPSALASRITQAIKADIETYKQIIAERKGSHGPEVLKADAVLAAMSKVRGGIVHGPGEGLQQSIAVDVEIIVASYVASAVMIAVAAYVVLIVVVALAPTNHPESKQIGGGMGRMDNQMFEDYMASAQMAKFMGAPKVEFEALRNLVHQELDAILEAMVSAELYERSVLENKEVREEIFKHVDEMLMLQ